MRRTLQRAARYALGITLAIAWFAPASKAATLEAIGASDFWFSFEEETLFIAETDAIRFGIDSMLWLYQQEEGQEQLIASNDDWQSLDSHIEVTLSPGNYRL